MIGGEDMVEHPRPKMGTGKEVLAKRIIAVILDTIILGVISGVFAAGGVLTAPALGIAGVLTFLFAGLGIFFFYSFLLEGYMGQTLGKKAVGIVVVKEDGSKCTYLASFVRNLLRIVDGMLYYLVGLIVIVLTDKNQRIGDYIANTVVLETADRIGSKSLAGRGTSTHKGL